MSVYREQGRRKRFDFWYKGTRYRKGGFRTKEQAATAERVLRDSLVDADAGIIRPTSLIGPRFSEWADVTYTYAVDREHLDDPASLDRNLRQMLRFFGTKPQTHPKAGPYHDLTLDAVLTDGSWITKFEAWMRDEQMAGSTKNHLRSAASKCYRVAMLPEYQAQTGITRNPFLGVARDRPRRRTAMFTKTQLRSILQRASSRLKLAIRIAVLAPELRLSNIAFLQWTEVDHFRWLRIAEHKTARRTMKPLVTPIVPALATYLRQAWKIRPTDCPTMLHAEGQPLREVRPIQDELHAICDALDIPYGVNAGVTFHSIRHSVQTWMAELDLPDTTRREAMGHASVQMTQWYTHLVPRHKIAPLRTLAANVGALLRDRSKSRSAPTTRSRLTRQRRVR